MSHPASRLHRALLGVLALSASIGLAVGPALAQGLPDVYKDKVEIPLKSLIKGTPSAYRAYPEPTLVPTPISRADMGKMGIESPMKSLIRKGSAGASIVAGSSGSVAKGSFSSLPGTKKARQAPSGASNGVTRLPEIEDKNLKADKVKPGLVAWHSTFQKAMAASARSGKPVFLFHMMGRLDDRFC